MHLNLHKTFSTPYGGCGLKKATMYAVLNVNYIKSKLKDYYYLPYKSESLHEVLFTDKNQMEFNVSKLDIAKSLIQRGLHPPTIYFPLIVSGAMLIEPTESESLSSLDNFISHLVDITKADVREIKEAPINCKRPKVDEVLAARNPILKGNIIG